MAALRVLSWNLHAGHGGAAAAQAALIAGAGADLAVLQEVVAGPAHEDLLAAAWPYRAFARARARRGGGEQGNLLLSRRPIAASAAHDLSNHPFERRVALHAVVDGVHLLAVHLDLSGLGRTRQLARLDAILAAATAGAGEPCVLAGDCNDWTHGLHRRLAARGFHEAHLTTHGRLARTFPARLPLLALDRIYARGLMPQAACRLAAARLSDHLPLLAEFAAA
jgi:endonuclease/exonuclease/phosphatase family metal-dependent hydrolase